MPKGHYDYYDVPGSVVDKGDQGQSYRFESTGRGKATQERWQRLMRTRIDIDGYPVDEVITTVQKAAEGLTDTYIDNTIHDDGGWDGRWIETTVSGWVEVVVGTGEFVNAHAEVAAVKRYVQDQYAKSQDVAAQQRAKAEAEIKRLAFQYPDLVSQYAPATTA